MKMKYVMAFMNGFVESFRAVMGDADRMWNEYIAYLDKKFPSKK